MCLLFESIKVKDRILHNLDYHNERMNRSRFELLGIKDEIDLYDCVQIPSYVNDQVFKCRVVYSKQIINIDFELYRMRKIDKLLLVESDLDYSYKYVDRKNILQLMKGIKPNEDILIIRNGFVTDSSYANVCFWDGNKWLTPDKPLLKGTKRHKLLDDGAIEEAKIRMKDLEKFEKLCLINGLVELEELICKSKKIKL